MPNHRRKEQRRGSHTQRSHEEDERRKGKERRSFKLDDLWEQTGKTREDSLRVERYDGAVLQSPVITKEGFMEADAFITRSGIFEYKLPAMREPLRELRPADQVFKQDSLDTLRMRPVTDEHPMVEGKRVLLGPNNVAQFTRGHMGENVSVIGNMVRAKMLITDGALIKSVQGGRNQLSCGYTCDLAFEPGVEDGKRYDAVQRNIVYNHVSVVSQGRAGAEVALRLDAADGIFIETTASLEEDVSLQGVEPPHKLILMKPFIGAV